MLSSGSYIVWQCKLIDSWLAIVSLTVIARVVLKLYLWSSPDCIYTLPNTCRYDTAICNNRRLIVSSKFLKRYSKAKRTRAPAYSRALRRIKGGFQRGQGKLRSDF